MHPSKWLWKAGPLRAVAESVAISAVLLLLVLTDTRQVALILFILAWSVWLCSIICAFRLCLQPLPLRSALVYDSRTGLLLVLLELGLVFIPIQLALDNSLAVQKSFTSGLFWIAGGSAIITFLLLRLAMRFWLIWAMIRRRRLQWSIVHAHLMTVLVLVLVATLAQVVYHLFTTPPAFAGRPSNGLITLIVIRTIEISILLFTFVVAIPPLVGVMLIAILMSYLTARQTTHRIEVLANATSSLRNGNYGVRVEIEGVDEIAQLQADFNVMLNHLEQTLAALKQERDTVTGLLRTRRELMAVVSHELRTPIAVMRSHLETIQARPEDTPLQTLRDEIKVMEHETIRLQMLVDDLFTLSRAEVGQLTLRCIPTDIKPIIQQVVQTTRPLAWASAKVHIVADLSAELPPALIDGSRLEQILHNLLHNGMRHSLPGGLIVISVHEHQQQVCIAVQDTGKGIAAEDLPHIWEQFYQGKTEDHFHSAGLGLALVKQLTSAMQGTVAVESTLGQGSCFRLSFPAT